MYLCNMKTQRASLRAELESPSPRAKVPFPASDLNTLTKAKSPPGWHPSDGSKYGSHTEGMRESRGLYLIPMEDLQLKHNCSRGA